MADPILCGHTFPIQSLNHTTYNHPSGDAMDESSLPIPPLDPDMLTGDFSLPDNFTDDFIDFDLDADIDFNFDADEFAFSDIRLLSDGSEAEALNPPISGDGVCPSELPRPNVEMRPVCQGNVSPEMKPFKLGFMEREGFRHSGEDQGFENQTTDGVRVSDNARPNTGNCDGVSSGPASSHESGDRRQNVGNASNCRTTGSNLKQKLDCPSPESGSCNQGSSHGSAEYNSVVSQADSHNSDNVSGYLQNSPSSPDNLKNNDSNDDQIKAEDDAADGVKCMSKRKKAVDDVSGETRTNKFRRSATVSETSILEGGDEEDEKRKARLMRNRESAQLSRQRKKQYVEELEDKVRNMQSTIADLNGKISYFMAENASLRQQLGGGVCPPPPPGMYPMAPMGYPWMPCPPYVVKAQGSHVPLVPIPRLKPQQPASAPKVNKKTDNKKSEKKKSEGKTKKVASISFLGLLFFILLFGGLVPIVNVRYRGLVNKMNTSDKYIDLHNGRVWTVDDHINITDRGRGNGNGYCHGTHCRGLKSDTGKKDGPDGLGAGGNASEPLLASLYVPRNDKLVKIDGNLIIHSVIASEKSKKGPEETSLAIHNSYVPYPVTSAGRSSGKQSHYERDASGRQRALGPGSSDDLQSAVSDGKVQQWFREGLAGPMLSSGMCTEVFQFEVSPTAGAIVPASPVTNSTSVHQQNSTKTTKTNRRILQGHPIPVDGRSLNVTEEHVIHNARMDGLQSNKSVSSMVVSVLVDPREVGDGDGESVIHPKSLSRIFVVVLIDSVKYVTYSCMLPLMGSGTHLVTA